MANHSIVIKIDTDSLSTIEDAYLAAYWQAAQLNPALASDMDASGLVRALENEIVQRWLKRAPVLQFNRTSDRYYRDTLRRHGSWPGPAHDTWVYEPGKAEREAAGDAPQAPAPAPAPEGGPNA